MPVPEEIVAAVAELSKQSGHHFIVDPKPVNGTDLYVVYATDHHLPDTYTLQAGLLGFRVPGNFPDAQPEDAFFIQPDNIKLKQPDLSRNTADINRASVRSDLFAGTTLTGQSALFFSWHLWDRRPWDRNTHTLIDHYQHCLRRFDQPEHD